MKIITAFGLMLMLLCSFSFIYAQDITNEECLECHSDPDLTKVTEDDVEISIYVNEEIYSNSVHGGFDCIECHDNIEELPHDEQLDHPNCNLCHEDTEEEYLKSFHGIGLLKGEEEAPYCWDCHTSHYVYTSDDSLSSVSILNQPETCAKCHSDPEIIKKYRIPISHPSELYKTSTHYKAAQESSAHTAKCSDCHGAHDLQPSFHPDSKTNKQNIPETCSACHEEIYQVYSESVHGAGGASDSPVCTDCHAEHAIKDHLDPESTVYSSVISKTLCPQCHEATRIVAKYSMSGGQVSSYNDSYHGLATRGGSVVSANCASCHGIHDIKPSDDPNSAIYKSNLPETCGKCHPGVSNQVTKGLIHIQPNTTDSKILYYVRLFYLTLIFAVIGGMIIHNGLDFVRKTKEKMDGKSVEHASNLLGNEYVRLSLNERIQHFLLMTSFTLLVISGFAMKFPEAWWAAPLIRWEGAFAFRGMLHRIAAGVMVGLSLYHVFYLIADRRGRGQFKSLLPKLKDITDVIDMFKYYLGFSKNKPKFDRFNYIEKAEYWALIWGTIVMSITGFILWFENFSMRMFPKWITDVSLIVHYYEAVLATLAILVWHFYFQFFDPHAYPMNFTCITGKMSEEKMEEEHPIELERLKQEGK